MRSKKMHEYENLFLNMQQEAISRRQRYSSWNNYIQACNTESQSSCMKIAFGIIATKLSSQHTTLYVDSKLVLNIDASTLAAGAYQYSLIVDERFLATKQMVISK